MKGPLMMRQLNETSKSLAGK